MFEAYSTTSHVHSLCTCKFQFNSYREEHQESVVNLYYRCYTIFERGTLDVPIANLIQFFTLLFTQLQFLNCLKLLPRKVSILILESDSPMYSVTRLNQFLKYVAVLHLIVFLICIGLLFYSRGFAFPTVFLPSSFLISLFDIFYLKVCGNFGPNCEPFSCHTVQLFAHV